jgi:hypothetical protein
VRRDRNFFFYFGVFAEAVFEKADAPAALSARTR